MSVMMCSIEWAWGQELCDARGATHGFTVTRACGLLGFRFLHTLKCSGLILGVGIKSSGCITGLPKGHCHAQSSFPHMEFYKDI